MLQNIFKQLQSKNLKKVDFLLVESPYSIFPTKFGPTPKLLGDFSHFSETYNSDQASRKEIWNKSYYDIYGNTGSVVFSPSIKECIRWLLQNLTLFSLCDTAQFAKFALSISGKEYQMNIVEIFGQFIQGQTTNCWHKKIISKLYWANTRMRNLYSQMKSKK